MNFFVISNIKDFVEIAFWLFGCFFAWQGLSAWKKQIRWNIEFETARKILNQIYKIRKWVEQVRNPILTYEMIYRWNQEWLSEKDVEIAWIKEAYNKRFELLDRTKQEILIDILEAEVLWWKAVKTKLYDFLYIIRKLEVAMQDFLKMKEMSSHQLNEVYWKKRFNEIDEIIYAKSLNSIEINQEDKYALELEKKIVDIENYLKKFLQIN